MKLTLEQVINDAIENNASDIHIVANQPIFARINANIKMLYQDTYQKFVVNNNQVRAFLEEILVYDQMQNLIVNKSLDLSMDIPGTDYRIRTHIFLHLNGYGINFRLIYNKPRSFEELNLPASIFKKWINLTSTTGGLIIISGLTNQGKTTTLSAIVNYINNNYTERIIVIEDPIEFVHESINSEIIQKEVPTHCTTYEEGLKNVLREDADTVVIGEIRTSDAMDMAIVLAEAGFRTIITIHSKDVFETIERIINIFPINYREKISHRLHWILTGVYHQKLVLSEEHIRIPKYEYLSCEDYRIKTDLKKGDITHLKSIVAEIPQSVYFNML